MTRFSAIEHGAPTGLHGRAGLPAGAGLPAHAGSAEAIEPGPTGVRTPERPRRRGSVGLGRIAGGAILPLVLLGLWQLTTSLGLFTIVQLPSPAMVVAAAIELVERGSLAVYVAVSTQRVIAGFVIGASLGLLLGAVTGLGRSWDTLFGSTLGAIRAVPSLAWVPLLILWLKIGEESKITLIAIGAFFPVYTTVSAALRHVDRQLVEVGRAFGLRGVRLFTTVQLPAVLPSVISGLRLALAQSWLFLVAAELIASSTGLGFLLVDSQNNGRVDRILLAIILLALLGKTTDALIGVFERWASRRWT
jgi:sulfonate transport system permease protein